MPSQTHDAPRTAAQEWRDHWGLVFAGMLGIGFIAVPATTLGLFMEPLQATFGWSRYDISLGMTVFALVSTPLAPFAGALADRYGSRRVALPGLVLNMLALAAFSLLTGRFWQYLLAWIAYSLTQLLVRTIIWNRAASAAFTVSRGLALAVMMAGIPIAQTVAPMLAQWLIRDLGWRGAYAGLAFGWGGIALVAALILFHEPGGRRAAATAAGRAPEPQPASQLGGLSFGEALRDWRVIRLGLAIFLQSAMATALSIHLFPLLTGEGLTRSAAAGIVALLGFAALAGQLVTGWFADRVTSTLLPIGCFALPALAYLLLLQGGGSTTVLSLAVLVGGFATSACITITTYLTTRYAGVRNFGKIYGLISSAMGLGSGLGPLLAGRIFDQTGSYAPFLVVGLAAAVIAAALVARLGAYPVFASGPREVARPG